MTESLGQRAPSPPTPAPGPDSREVPSVTNEGAPLSVVAEVDKKGRPVKDGIGWGDPFCVTPALPDRDCDIDACERDALWTVEAMGCHYDGEAPEQGPTAEACAEHVSTLMERWTW